MNLLTPGTPQSPFEVQVGDVWHENWSDVPPVARRYRAILANEAGEITSSNLLYMIMNRGPVADPDIISQFRPDEIGDNEFVDGWNNPIRFKRWPVGFKSPYQPIDGALSSRDDRTL